MKIVVTHKKDSYEVDLSKPLDICIPFEAGEGHVIAWYQGPVKMEPVRMGDWVGSVKEGAGVNFNNIFFNPHAHGTHTETVGHISKNEESINTHFKEYFCFANLISIQPEKKGDDLVITLSQIKDACSEPSNAFIIRTLPNEGNKLSKNYSKSNPPYLEEAAATWLREQGVRHLMIDLPSVDREEDGGKLLAHHAFWNHPQATRLDATITELIFVADKIKDGFYFMNLQVAPFVNDAAPSRPLLFELKKS
jgi:arylformamidase